VKVRKELRRQCLLFDKYYPYGVKDLPEVFDVSAYVLVHDGS